jgi:mannose-1-phosphate guanylyltransferase/phosphomannomutase
VVALNEAVDETKMSIPPEELRASLSQLSKICGVLETTLGVRLDVGGERVFVVNSDRGLIDGTLLAAAMAIMTYRSQPGGTIAVPVSMPSVFERIAEQYGGEIARTKVNLQSLMEAANHPDVVMAADGNGSFIWPAFQPVVDGMMTVAKLLEFIATQKTTLPTALDEVPPFYMAQGQVNCPWEAKGRVMRLLNQQYKDRLREQIDGVKIHLGDGEWVLVLPDPDRPLFHISAEGRSREQAEDLVARYERIVEGLQS